MMPAYRIVHEPAFVLHRYDWSESSLILEVFTRHQGRVALVAKGAKRPSSNFRPVLLPLQPLHLNYSGDGEIRTLKGAEWLGGQVMPSGDALLSGYYVNELLLRLLARDDAHEALFDTYVGVVQVLGAAHGAAQVATRAAALRAFELLLLREVGLLPALDLSTSTRVALESDRRYALRAEGGLGEIEMGQDRNIQPVGRNAGDGAPAPERSVALSGADWQALERALRSSAPPFAATVRAVADLADAKASSLRMLLRALLNYHCGVSTLRTRQMMRDLQAL
ncbi:MAG: DNA repair protein RecO [Variovorax sp.]